VALLFDQQKLYPRAREWYDRALAIDPDFIEARTARAKLPP
jgi:tetratricopeptide (TPR) repeat protein